MIGFGYHPEIVKRFPGLCGGVVLMQDALNLQSPESLKKLFYNEQLEISDRIGVSPLSAIESLSAWRGVFRSFGVDPTKYRSAAEALLRRLIKKGDIPSINSLVDICNLVSIRYALPVAAFDARELNSVITVQFADGSESFLAHDQEQVEHPEPGEVIFCDDTGLVYARRWCWKQSLQSVVSETTNLAVITIEAVHSGAESSIENGIGDLLELMQKYLGGIYQSGVVGGDQLVVRSD